MAELIWDGKYDASGKRVAPLRLALPFQTIETVNESRADRERTRSLFADGGEAQWRNRLIWGDKKYVLPSLLSELAGQVNLIYIDPPFDTGANFSFTAQIPDDPHTPGDQSTSFVKEPSILELKAYRDIWGTSANHLDSYLKWFADTIALLYDLLHPNGSIYVHLDYHVAPYAKVLLDEIFGADQFHNDIRWIRSLPHNDPKQFGRFSDVIFYYSKSNVRVFNVQYAPQKEESVEAHYRKDVDGRLYRLASLLAPGNRGPKYLYKGFEKNWRFTKAKMLELEDSGRVFHKEGQMPSRIYYLDESLGSQIQDVWADVSPLNPMATERVNYPTQKPQALLERIIKASSNEGDLVLDCFCGSGTTAAVAEKLKRRWITCDLGRFAIHTARKRLLGIAEVRPFVVQNLGKYERQAWQRGEFGNDQSTLDAERHKQRRYLDFMLQLYRAKPLDGFVWLHGVKNGRYVHIGGVDAPVTDGDLKQIALEFRRAVGSGEGAPTSNGIDVLGWDWAFEINEAAKQQASQANIHISFRLIPREVMEKRAVEQGDIQFLELAALGVAVAVKNRTVTLQLSNFAIPPDYVPEAIRGQITHWEQYIDYWAVDWNHQSTLDTFHNEWQSYRTRSAKTLDTRVSHTYEEKGNYRIVVKAIDILGNDTTKVLRVDVE